MAKILLKRDYENRNIPNQPALWLLQWFFNTEAEADEYEEIGVITGGPNSNFAQYGNLPLFERGAAEVIWSRCGPTVADQSRARTTKTTWLYVANPRGTTTITVTPNSTDCGFVAPSVLLCRILIPRVTVAGTTATVTTAEAAGQVEYQLLNQGGQIVRPRQTSNVFAGLAPAIYTVEAFDTGSQVPGCKATSQFTVSVQSSGVATLSPLPELSFAGNPIIVRATASLAGRPLLLRVYLETSHGSNNFKMVYEAVRPTNEAAVATLDVRDMLRSDLQPELKTAPGWHQLTRPIRRWYVSVCEVQNGALGLLNTSPFVTVLLGGLPQEMLAEGVQFFLDAPLQGSVRRELGFFSWQPTDKQVGAGHLEVLQVLHRTGDEPELQVAHNPIGADPALIQLFPHPALEDMGIGVGDGSGSPIQDEADRPDWQLSQFIYSVPLQAPLSTRLQLQLRYPNSDYLVFRRKSIDIERDPLIEPRQFVYENSLGGFDTMAAFGQLRASLSTEQQLVSRYEPVVGVETAREMSWPANGNRLTMALGTGWLTAHWLEYLQELFKPGREVYEVVNGQLRPVVLTTKELATYRDNNNDIFAVLEYRSAYSSNYYADYARNTNRS
ncbi:hypothetical protein [Hymenobacter sp. BT190]|uniref:hypothetical protein n=1 Tax=Hymenobacter sp. BT190 TaxID=2763505 RepID=UPI001651957A|nr:hypothetical protein [Hymenobacter sp. BT190]MBC6698093.1 hypothetical protein [Hymenobacter sp. BT190]